MRSHTSFCLSLLDKQQACEILTDLHNRIVTVAEADHTDAESDTEKPKDLRETLRELKQMYADIKVKLRKRKITIPYTAAV